MSLKRFLAFTLLEVLVTIAVIGGVAAGAYLIFSNVAATSDRAKLEQDVAVVNRAIQVYQTHGGKIPSGLTADQVLARLRREAANPRLAGIKGTLIDPRLNIRWQGVSEAGSGKLRAYWDDTSKKFTLAETGSGPGVKEFYTGNLPEALPIGVDENGNQVDPNKDDRSTTGQFAAVDKWVWDYLSDGGVGRNAPSQIPTAGVEPTTGSAPENANAVPLDPPVFSTLTGRFDIDWFPGTVTLSLPPSAPPTVAEIYYYVTGGSWQRYEAAIKVDPGMVVTARTVTLDPDRFEDSATVAETYYLNSFKLELTGQFPKNNFNYRELGGAMAGAPAAPAAPYGSVNVTNLTAVPADYVSSTKFQIYWTFDGSDPSLAGSTTRVAGQAFEGSYNGTQLPVNLASYAPDGKAKVRIRAVALDTQLFISSDEVVIDLGIEKMTLPGTLMTLDNDKVVMSSVQDSTLLPAGSRIFYTDNGTDPGDNGGEPAAVPSALYAGPVTYPAGLTEYNARTYPPVDYKLWFDAGAPSSIGTGSTPEGYYFAVGNGDNKLYQFDATSGSNIVRSSECIYPPAAVAFLADTGRVYYIEQSGGNWNLARYDLSTGSHAPAGSLTSAGLDYVPAAQPKNLVGYNSSLYYVAEDTDDLVRVDFAPNGTIRAQYKFADIADDLMAFHKVGDVAADTSGTLYVASENAWATYNLKSLSGFAVPVASPAWVWNGLVTGGGNQIYGVRNSEPNKFYAVNISNGQGSAPVEFSPVRSFEDFAGPLANVPFQMSPGHFAISPGADDVLRLNIDSGRQYTFASGIGFQPTAIAADNAGGFIYVAGPDPASSSSYLLKKVSVASGEISTVGSLSESTLEYLPQGTPDSMVWYSGALYYMGHGTDDLVKITLNGDAIASQAKVADILDGVSIHPILGVIDAMTVGPDGQLYLASRDHQLLASYDIANLTGFNVIKSAGTTSYTAITYRSDQQMFGVPSTTDETKRQIFSVDDNTGAQQFAKNVIPAMEISDITGLFDGAPVAVNSEMFAVDGVTTRIYRFEPATGQNAVLTAGAPWPLGAVAYDGENQRVYYTRKSGFDVGVYNIASKTHGIAGSLNAASLTYAAANSPENLTFFNGSLYYVPKDSDDLVRVDLNQANMIADAWKEADLVANASIDPVGDLAMDGNGYLYFSYGSVFARFDMKSMSGYTEIATGISSYYDSLFSAGGPTLFGMTKDLPKNIVIVSTTDGSVTNLSTTTPSRIFIDTASTQPRVDLTPAGGINYASATGKNAIYSINLQTGAMRPVTASCPVQPEALAYDSDKQAVFYTENTSSDTNIGLYKYELGSRRHTFVGNLAAPGLGYPITSSPHNLVYFAGGLYCIPDGDDLVRLNLTADALTSLTKFADISGNTKSPGNVGAFAVGNTGIGWISQDSGNLLAKFDFYTRNGYAEVNTTDARMTSLAFSAANVLYGTHNSSQNVLQTVNQGTGARTLPVNTSPSFSIRDITGNNSRPQPVLPDCYAVGGGNTSIYRFDPATGVTYTITSSTPFVPVALARDPVNNFLFYIENTPSNWRLARYEVTTGVHRELGMIGNGTWNYATSVRPDNLFYYGGQLYYIAPGSDDLVQIGLNASGTAVTGVFKAADIADDTANLGNVGDVAVDSSGRAWVGTGNAVVGYFSMVTLSGYTQLTSAQQNYNSLLFTSTGSFYGSHAGGDASVYAVSPTSGAATLSADTFPSVTFWDMAGNEVSVPYSRSNSLWALSEGHGRLGEFVNWNLPNVSARSYGAVRYLNNGVVTAFSGAINIESMAVTQTGTAYFVRNQPTLVNGVTYKRPLFSFETGTLTWGTSPTVPVATFVGDLESALSILGPVGEAAELDEVNGLAIGPDQRLWVLYGEGDSSTNDYLLRINSFATSTNGALNNVSVIGALTGSGEAVTLGQDMVFQGSKLYVTDDADDKVYSVDYATGSIDEVVSADAGTKYEALTLFAPTGEIVGSNTDSGNDFPETIRRIRPGNGNDTTRFGYYSLSNNALVDIEGLAFAGGTLTGGNTPPAPYFAINRTNSIFRVDPLTGTVTTLTASAPYTLDAVAYDQTGDVLYYVQNSNATILLGKYDLNTGAHTALGDLKTVGTYRPSTHPQHLIFYQGDLFYISGNGVSQTFLIRVQLSPAAILAQDSMSRISATSSWTVTAAALDDTGKLYFREGANLRSYDLRRMGNLTTVTTTAAPYESLLYASGSGTFFGARSSALDSSESVNMTTGTGGTPVATSPSIQMYDMSGGHSAPAQLWVNTNFYATGGNSSDIYVVDPANAANSLKTASPLMSGIATIAVDPAGDLAYYIQQGAPYTLAVYNRTSNTHTELAQLANTGTVRPAVQPDNLTWFNGHLYWLQSNTDNLYKIELKPDGTFSDTFLAADIAGNEETAFGTVGDLAVDETGLLYISGSNRFASFNLATMSGYSTIALNPSFVWSGLMIAADGIGLFGVRNSEPGNLYTINVADNSATLVGAFDAVRSISDLASPQVPVTSQTPGQRYFVSQNSKSVYRIDLTTGRSYRITSQIPYQPAGIAHDFTNNRLFLAVHTGASAAAPGTVRLVSYNLSTGMPADIASLSSGWSYNAPAMPQALVYAQDAVYYIPPQTDDLVKVTLSGNTVSAQAKVADVAANANLGNIGALTVSPDGTLYISRTDSNLLAKYNFSSLSGYSNIRTTPKASYHGLTYDDNGVLHGVISGEDTVLYTVNTASGFPTLKVTGSTPVYDITGLNTDILPAFSRSLWTISRNGTNAQLIEVKNYDQPATRTKVVWGNLVYNNGTTFVPMANSSIQIYGLALSSSGVGYFTATGPTTISGVTYQMGLYKLDLGALQTGVLPRVTFLGDLKPRLDALSPQTGTSESRWITGMTIDPVTGKLYGMLLDGSSSGADVLFTVNSLLKGSGNALQDISVIGKMTGTASISHGKSLIFDRSGTLYAADYNDYTVDILNSTTGADVGTFSSASDGSARYSAMAVDPVTGQVIGTEFSTQATRTLVAGANNDPLNFNFSSDLSMGAVYAMSFLTWPVVLPETPPAVYYAVNGTSTLYSFSVTTGATTSLSPVAPFAAKSLAFDPQARILYYLENAATGFRLGKLDLNTNAHTTMGNLDVKASGTWSYDPSALPTNLEFSGGSLYYVHPNSDDLVRVLFSGNTIIDQVKVADLTANASTFGGGVTELTVGGDGRLWISALSGLYNYDLSLLTGFTTVATGTEFSGIFFEQTGGDLYGTTFTQQTGVHSVDKTSGSMTMVATTAPAISFEDFGAYPPLPANPVGTYYAVNGTRTLYLVDQTNGSVSAANAGAPYDMSGVCFDVDNNLVYYTQGGTDTWSVGQYNPATGVHTDLGRAPETGTYNSPSGPQPNNLFVFNSQLYYLKPGTDDLMRIDLTAAGSGLAAYYKVADVTGNASVFASVGDVAVSSSGLAYFATPSLLGKFDLKSMSGYQPVTSSPAADWKALLMAADNQLYGIKSQDPAKIFRINQTNGAQTYVADISAGLQFSDLGGRHPRVTPQLLSTQVFMSVSNSPTIHLANVTTGANRMLTSNAPFGVNAVAYDYDSGSVYYTEYSDSSMRLGKYDLRSSTHSIVADLAANTWAYRATARINNLIYSNGDLYYVHKDTDDLVRIGLNNGALSGQTLAAHITNGAKSLGDVGALALDDGGYLYISRQDTPLLARYNMARFSRYTELNTTTAQFRSMVLHEGTLYAGTTAQSDRLISVNPDTGAAVTTFPQTAPLAAIEDLAWATPEFSTPSTRYYATDKSSTIYQVDPASGATVSFASVAPMTAEGVAYDLASDFIYYLEKPGAGYRLARLDADSGTNTILGSLQQPGFSYVPADQPRSMVCYNGSLYYIARNTDDLVRITIGTSGITAQEKVTDLTNYSACWDVAAMALKNDGQLYFRTGNSLYRCDLRMAGGGLTLLTSSGPQLDSLLFTEDSATLYGSQSGSLTRVDTINASNGTPTNGAMTNPAVELYEMTGPNTAPAPDPVSYYAANGTTTLYKVNPATSVVTPVAGVAPFTFNTLAYDQAAGIVYLVANTDSSTRLAKYTIATGAFSIIGQFIDKAWSGLTIPIRPMSLVAYQGALYYVRRSTTTAERDDLIRITFTSAGAIATQSKVADINANANPGDATAATVDDSGMMYFSTNATTPTLCRYDLRNLSGYTVVKSGFVNQTGLLWRRENATLYSSPAAAATTIYPVNMSTYAVGTAITTSPAITISDLASGNTAPPPPWNSVPAVYIGGDFYRTSGSDFRGVAKLDSNGELDTSFNPGTGVEAGATVRAIARTSSGQVLAGGDFLTFNGTNRIALARLNGDGSLDTSFAPDISQSPGGTSGTAFTADWSTLGLNQDAALGGADTNFVNSSSPLHGMSAGGGFAGFSYQTFNNVGGSGVSMTTYFSDNMSESGGFLDGQLDGPNLFGPSGSGANGGVHPDRRVVGPWSMRFNNDQTGTITPTTVGLSFSEPVFLNQVLLGGLSQVAGTGVSFGSNILLNGSFETGAWSSPTWFPSTTDVNKKPAIRNITGSTINNWSPDKLDWIEDSTRAPQGNRFIYILPSDQSWNYCAGQNLTVGGSSSGRQLITGRTYRVRYNCLAFNPNLPAGAGATTGKPAVEYGYTTSSGGSGFAELYNMRDDATGLPMEAIPAGDWNNLQWRSVTGYLTAPAVSSSNYNLTLWLSMVKNAGTTSSTNFMNAFNVISFESLTASDTVAGRVMVGGDILGLNTPKLGEQYTPGTTTTTLVVGGSIVGSSAMAPINFYGGANARLMLEDSAARGSRPISLQGGGTAATRIFYDNTVDDQVATARTDLEARSVIFKSLPANSTVSSPSSSSRVLTCNPQTVAGQSQIAVFNVDPATLFSSGVSSIDISSATTVQGVIINVSGSNFSWTSGPSLTGNFTSAAWRQKIIWNFPDCTSFNINGRNLMGGVLAPKADMSLSSCEAFGSVVAKSINSEGSKIHYVPMTFNGFTSIASNLTTSGMLFDNVRVEEILTTAPAFEHAYIRAFSTADGTGTPVAADSYQNLSAQTTALLGSSTDPATTADANNVRMDNDTSNNVYHSIGMGAESGNRYGRVKISYAGQPVRSVAISFWASNDTEVVGGVTLPRFDGGLTGSGVTASLSNLTFRRAASLPGKVWAVAEQADGKLLIGGNFTMVNGVARKNIARLNPDGTTDTTFDPGTGPDADVRAIEVASDGSILAGGDFSTWNGSSAGARIVLLSSTGARDTGWTSSLSVAAGDTVKWIKAAGGGVYVGGKFSAPRSGIARLTMTGANDTAFNPGTGTGTTTVNSGLVLDDGKLLIAGDFTSVNGTVRNRIARLTAAGALDTAFAPSPAFDSVVHALLRLPGADYAHAAGAFATFNGSTRNKVTVFNTASGVAGTTTWGPTGLTVTAIYTAE